MKIDAGASYAFLAGGGKLGELISAFDWSTTSLGPIGNWPSVLKTSVSLALRSPVPIVMLWGVDGIMIYNDAYAVFAGGRHPQLLGSKVREGWPEVAAFNDNIMKVVLAGGTLSYRDQELLLFRHGEAETLFTDLDYSPILDETGKPVAVIAFVTETTQRVMAERYRDGERKRLRDMFEQAPSFITILSGPDHTFELTNQAYRQLIGHRNVIGKPIREALPDLAGQGFYELLDSVYASGVPFIGDASRVDLERTPGAQPEARYVDFVYQPIRDGEGNVTGIFAGGSDVTERIAAEAAIRATGDEFRLLAEAMPNHVWTSRPDGHLDWFNSQVYRYAGAQPGELDGDKWAVIVHPDDVAAAAAIWTRSIQSGDDYQMQFRLRRADGAYRWHLARAAAQRDDTGAITRWIGSNTDIDEERHAQEALLNSEARLGESERRLRLSQSAAGIASLELDVATGNVMGSDNFWDLWGLSKRDSVHISVLENIVIPEDADIRSTEATRQAGSARPEVEYRIKRADTGELRWLSRNIEFTYDDAGQPVKMFGIMQDVTERKEAQGRQELLTHELEHRIKNILAMVSAIASQTLRKTDIDSGREALNERLRALASAHDILTRTRWTTASIGEVVTSATSSLPPDRVTVDGPVVALGPKMALSMALAINELGTNTLKYGALTGDAGAVDIRWSTVDGTLRWTWAESGGPEVSPPSRKGFGRFLIERVLASDFAGTVTLDYQPQGLVCTLIAPLPGGQPPARQS